MKVGHRQPNIVLVLLLLFGLLGAGKLEAQTGSVAGVVTDAATRQPVAGVYVFVPQLNRAVLSQESGRYLLSNIPVGTHEVRVQSIGYGTVNRQVTVVADQTATLDFVVSPSAIALDEVVVTGAGKAVERKKLGNTIATVNSQDLEKAPVSSASGLLQGRVAGLVATPSSGDAGGGTAIRIRGTASLSQSNDPVVYVDGIRIDSKASGVNVFTSRLDDINPDDIERIEVLKGAAAATLYGTEANNGVIQIFTKRGRQGKPAFQFSTDHGLSRTPRGRIPDNTVFDPSTGEIIRTNPMLSVLKDNYRQSHNLSVRGGSEGIAYYASAWLTDESGTFPNDRNAYQNYGIRSNLNLTPSEKYGFDLNIAYAHTDFRPTLSWGHPGGIHGNALLANPLLASPERPNGEISTDLKNTVQIGNRQLVNRLTIGTKFSYFWSPNLNSEATIGYDYVDDNSEELWPFGVLINGERRGLRNLILREKGVFTFDVKTAWSKQLTDKLNSSSVVGAQGFFDHLVTTSAGVRSFSGSGSTTLRGGATITNLDEFKQEVINAGFFFQEQLDIADQLFVTAGLRVDGNSAFGRDFGLQRYPKLSASYVPSDAPFWNLSWMPTFRVRAAYGTSGLQPGAYDAQQTWSPRPMLDNEPAVVPGNLGNSGLKPERSEEIELGFDMGLFDRRVALEVTYFDQVTNDALLPRRYAPSQGFLNPQLENIGEVRASGLEASLDWMVARSDNLTWNIRTSIATLDQEVVDMGGAAAFNVSESFRPPHSIAQGYQPGALLGNALDPKNPYTILVDLSKFNDVSQVRANRVATAAGKDSTVFLGNPLPSLTGTFSTTLNLSGLELSAMIQGASGFVMWDETSLLRNQFGLTEEVAQIQKELKTPTTTAARKQELAAQYARIHWNVQGNWVKPGDYLRLQEISARYPIPESVVRSIRLPISSMTVSIAATNLFTVTKYDGIADPGTSAINASANFNRNMDRFQLPLARGFRLSLDASF